MEQLIECREKTSNNECDSPRLKSTTLTIEKKLNPFGTHRITESVAEWCPFTPSQSASQCLQDTRSMRPRMWRTTAVRLSWNWPWPWRTEKKRPVTKRGWIKLYTFHPHQRNYQHKLIMLVVPPPQRLWAGLGWLVGIYARMTPFFSGGLCPTPEPLWERFLMLLCVVCWYLETLFFCAQEYFFNLNASGRRKHADTGSHGLMQWRA